MKTPIFCGLFMSFVLMIACNSPKEEEPFDTEQLNVQEYELQGAPFDFAGIVIGDSEDWRSLINRTPVKAFLKESDGGTALKIKLDRNIGGSSAEKDTFNLEGAYTLKVDKEEGISLVAKDSAGVFYGLQTLHTLVFNGTIQPISIQDYPTFPYRGVVEGFYGTPWSTEDRIRQIEFYGKVKANTYIYGPKDDPYHSSPNWRKPYPNDQAESIRKLVRAANANFVDFVWAIHPGKDIKWNAEDRDNVLDKFEHMYDLGVRSFAIFFDDISGEGTNAHKQAALLNYLTEEFVQVKKDVKPLILTPTDYNKGWAAPGPDGYLSILGRELDPSVQVMWTGDNVMSDVTQSTADWVKERIQRPSLIWWNFPVSDYQRNRLFLEPSYGLEENLNAGDITGVLSNPMEHAEASKPAIYGVAHYAWNAKAYQPVAVWKQSIEKMLPKTHKAYVFFAENNGTPNTDLTSHRDKESEAILTLSRGVQEALKGDSPVKEEELDSLMNYFKRMQEVEAALLDANEDPDLLQEIKPWLQEFTNLGKIGEGQLANYRLADKDTREYWGALQQHQEETAQDRVFQLGDSTKVQITTGSAVLRPLIKSFEVWNNKRLLSKITGDEDLEVLNPELGRLGTPIGQLKGLKVIAETENKIRLQPLLEVFAMDPGEAFTLELTTPIRRGTVKFYYNSGYYKWLKIETSEKGENWKDINFQEKNWQEARFDFTQPVKYVRISNKNDEMIDLRLFEFSITETPEGDENESYLVHDLDVFTYTDVAAHTTLVEKAPESEVNEVIILTDSNDVNIKLEGKKADGNWEDFPDSYRGKLIEADLPEHYNGIRVKPEDDLKVYEVVWK